ncbi:MAG: class I SAM-dependent RNA methyltransferase [Armatimonadetes bacterium]|nr:class I SAM-dependent RNA methyltransferase [Armatimonadota bacterium]
MAQVQLSAFHAVLAQEVQAARPRPRQLAAGECRTAEGRPCPICWGRELEYPQELALKEKALERWWASNLGRTPREPLLSASEGRSYRSVTKRRAFAAGRLGLVDGSGRGVRPLSVARCAIEPELHTRIYANVEKQLADKKRLSSRLNYVVLKTHARGTAIILNLSEASRPVHVEADRLLRNLSSAHPELTAGFLYQASPGSHYYLDAGGRLERVFGKPRLVVEVAGCRLEYSPLSFSQIHLGMLEPLVDCARTMLELDRGTTFWDLYCGYGLFAVALGPLASRTAGADVSPESIASARANARRNGLARCRFWQGDLRPSMLQCLPTGRPLAVLLDPPRQGPARGLVDRLAAIGPRRAVHVFCDIDRLPADLGIWRRRGYAVTRAQPLDLFPGTSSIEVMVALARRS